MTEREEFWQIVELLGLPHVRGVGKSGSLYTEDIEAIARAVGVEYEGERTRTWAAIIEKLGGDVDPERDISTGGTIEKEGLAKVRDLLRAGTGARESAPTLPVTAAALEGSGVYNPCEAVDRRTYTMRAIAQRQGQPAFRRKLLLAYKRCAVTRASQPQVLEAAHIDGYKGPDSNHVTNGLLLRADIHILFDIGLIAINTADMTAIVSRDLTDPCYVALRGVQLSLPEDPADHPSPVALDFHRQGFNV